MAEEKNMEEKNIKVDKKKDKGFGKFIIIFIIIFIIVPLIALVSFYFLNDTFKFRVNNSLSTAPIVGSYFENQPTKKEIKEDIDKLAKYFLDISFDRTIDKLNVIKGEDKGLYNDIINAMIQRDPNKTKLVLENIREKEMKGSTLSKALEDIEKDQEEEFANTIKKLEDMPFSSLKKEVYDIINGSLNGHSNLAKMLSAMKTAKAYSILNLLDESDRDKVISFMDSDVSEKIEKEKNFVLADKEKLINQSNIYKSKNVEDLKLILNSTATYNIDQLSVIFKELGPVYTGRILASSVDDQFVSDVIKNIKNNEIAESGEDLLTKDILKSLKIYKEFDDNIIQVTNVYKAMSLSKVSEMLSDMLSGNSLPQVYVLDNGDVITITDEDLAYRILKGFDNKDIAKIISGFDANLASEVSKKMSIPEY